MMARLGFLVGTACVLAIGASGCGGNGDNGALDAGTDAGTDGGGSCGDGVVQSPEQCDDGNTTDGDGCDSDCTYTCSVDADCDDGLECNGIETCKTTMHVCQAGSQAPDGTNCNYEDVVTSPGDAGVGDGGSSEPLLGRCISGQCGKPCDSDLDCLNGNPCDGDEFCNMTYGSCAPGTALDCDDGEVCTDDSCDPSAPSGCVHSLLNDGDGDGHVDESITCNDPSLGGDCDDGDDTVYPGAPELCDMKDNDCDDVVDNDKPLWYLDCDGDGYAAMGAANTQSCTEPAPQGDCGWTTKVPSNLSTTDCDDSNIDVHPGHTAYEDKPYCLKAGTTASGTAPSFTCPSGGTVEWDWNCNEQPDKRYRVGSFTCSGTSCPSSTGWVGSVPGCGQTAAYQNCTNSTSTICCGFNSKGLCTDYCTYPVCTDSGTTQVQQTCR